ncbi:MAG: MFS transporter [Bacilli bacterium]|jgi:melibiose permease/lactose/raffinose/galactose permease|nr:MFS transporter [Bacilli bacterium]MCH4228226.1 MFS transporter [Bacilli bacterium]MCH4277420.1 MFS transporter [Bacilli bacterium]MCI2055263.1 MFS transporter [Bacilli bacterium]
MAEKQHRGLTAGTYSGDKIPKFTKWYYPFSGIFRDACYALVGTFLLQYTMYAGVLSSDPATYQSQISVITIALVIALIWDGLNDPIMGIIVEKVHFKTGKFRPWILIGAIGNAIVVSLMFNAVQPGGDGWLYTGMMIFFYFLWDFCFTMNDIGYWSMLPSLTSDEKERSTITTLVTIATTIGGFAMNIVCFLLPGLLPVSTAQFYGGTALIISALFLISQALVFFLCKEHARDPKQDEISSKTKFRDLFKILRNKPLRISVITMLLYYMAGGLITTIGVNYFYFAYGYGGSKGGFIATILSVIYVVATLIAQSLYPLLIKHFKKRTILTATTVVIIVCYLVFLCIAFPIFGEHPLAYNDPSLVDTVGSFGWFFGGSLWTLIIPAFFFFGAQGIFYLVLLVMFQNSIEYNEWKYGERKESVAFSWRPLDAKFSSAFQKGIMNVTFMISGLYTTAVVGISTQESLYNSGYYGTGESAQTSYLTAINNILSGIESWQLATVGYITIGIIVVCFAVGYYLIRFKYGLSDDEYTAIYKELEVRHQKDIAEASKTNGGVQA